MSQIQLLATLKGHSERVWHCSWHPSGTLLATAGGGGAAGGGAGGAAAQHSDNKVRIWGNQGEEWVCLFVLSDCHTRTVRKSMWEPKDGNILACGSFDGTASIWQKGTNADSTTEFVNIGVLEGHENEIKAVAWSSSGTLLATCSRDKSIWIWEMEEDNEFECIAVLHGHSQDVKSIKWHPELEVLVSCSYDDTVKVWVEDDGDWVCKQTLQSHKSTVWEISFDDTGDYLASSSDDNSVILWRFNKNAFGGGDSASFLSHACTISGYNNRTVYSVDWTSVDGSENTEGDQRSEGTLSSGTYVATGSADNSICIFSITKASDASLTSTLVCCHKNAHSNDVNNVSWNPKHKNILASCGDDGLTKIWKLV